MKRDRKLPAPSRRDGVVDAALRIIARDGFEGATVRAIAREAGCTTGVPMHHFAGKDDLLFAALERVLGILDRGPMGRAPGPDALADLREVLREGLPLDEERQAAWRIWLHCITQALSRPRFAAEHRRRYGAIREWLADTLRRAQRAGQVPRGLDPTVEAERLLSGVDGIGTHAVLEPESFPRDVQLALLERHLRPLIAPAKSH